MAEDPSGASPDDAKLSWREREMVAALKRLANAQAQVSQIDAQLAASPRAESSTAASPEPADLAALEETVSELAKLAKKSQSRFGGGSAREKTAELEARQRLLLDRMGFANYEEFATATSQRAAAPAAPEPGVDPVVEGFARRELAAAETAYRELLLLPDDEPDDAGGSAAADDSYPTIDLTG